jgi:hypothetical protein
LIVATLTVGACDAVNEIANIGNDADVHYYVSLGTSLSVGVQPNSSGTPLLTGDGYADQLFASIKPAFEAAGAQPPPNELLPVNVANICELTYMCDPEPVGPDIHANFAGYSLIADTFAAVLP